MIETFASPAGDFRLVSGILTQGKSDTDDWVTEYRLGHSIDGKKWNIYKEDGKEKVWHHLHEMVI